MKISERSKVAPFLVMEVMRQAARRERAGQDLIHMEVGQPGTPAPKLAREAVLAHIDEPLGYTLSLGRDDLRAAIAKKYLDEIGRNIAPERIILTTGSSTGFQLAFTALFDAGERVGIAEPGYPSYRNILKAMSLQAVGIVTRYEEGFHPCPADISKSKMDGVLIASPSNPTGTILDFATMKALIDKAHAEDMPFISDEIYHGLTYGQRAISALEVTDDVIVINSFSKYYSMTGWRLGWMVVPNEMVNIFEPLTQNMYISPPHISQIAALGALESVEECEANLAVYARNRDHLLKALPEIGLSQFSSPDGGFYFYCYCGNLTKDSRELAEAWLDFGVAATPGWDFDPVRGGQYIRLSYASTERNILEAIRRLKAWAAARF